MDISLRIGKIIHKSVAYSEFISDVYSIKMGKEISKASPQLKIKK